MKKLLVLLLLSSTALAAQGDPWIGLVLTDKGAKFGGTRVREVIPGSPGQKAGLTAGDEVLSIDDHPTRTSQALVGEVRRAGVGHSVKLRVADEKGHTRAATVKLSAMPSMEELQRAQLLGKPAPDFQPAIQAGAKLGPISSLRGKVVLIDFFATWCGPCVMSMPHLEELHTKLGPKGLTVLGVSTESASIVARAAERFDLTYSLASDEDEAVSGRYRVFALPTMVLIDKKGIVREVSVNDPDAIEAAIAKALK